MTPTPEDIKELNSRLWNTNKKLFARYKKEWMAYRDENGCSSEEAKAFIHERYIALLADPELLEETIDEVSIDQKKGKPGDSEMPLYEAYRWAHAAYGRENATGRKTRPSQAPNDDCWAALVQARANIEKFQMALHRLKPSSKNKDHKEKAERQAVDKIQRQIAAEISVLQSSSDRSG